MAGHGCDEVTDLGLAYKIDAGVTKIKNCKQLKCIDQQYMRLLVWKRGAKQIQRRMNSFCNRQN